MTENYAPTSYAPPRYGTDDTATSETGTKDVAKQQAGQVGQSAVEAGQHVADVAKEQGGQVVREAGQQAKDLALQAQGQLKEQAGVQQQKLSGGLRSVSDQLGAMADGNGQPGPVSDLARQAADRAGAVAEWLDGREPGDVLNEVTRFARRRPGAFLAVAAGVGFLAGRLTRGLQAQASDDSSPAGHPAPVPAPYPEVPPMTPPPAAGFGETSLDTPPLSPQVFPETGYLGEGR